MKLIRDFDTLTKRKKIAVGIFSTIVGCFVLLIMDLSMGFSFDQAIKELSITVVVSLLASVLYGIVVRLRLLKP